MQELIIRSVYRHRPGRVTVSFNKPSLAQQHFKDECDINMIMRRYTETGLLTDPFHKPTAAPQFGDFSTAHSYMESMNVIVRARENFDGLPSNIRERFNNDPYRFLEFVNDEGNLDEAVKLGLVSRPNPPAPDAGSAAEAGTPAGGETL